MTSNLYQVEIGKRGPRVGSNAAHSRCAFDSQVKVYGEDRINRRDLGACVHQEVVVARLAATKRLTSDIENHLSLVG